MKAYAARKPGQPCDGLRNEAAASSGPPSPGVSSFCESRALPEDPPLFDPLSWSKTTSVAVYFCKNTLFESATIGRILQLFG